MRKKKVGYRATQLCFPPVVWLMHSLLLFPLVLLVPIIGRPWDYGLSPHKQARLLDDF